MNNVSEKIVGVSYQRLSEAEEKQIEDSLTRSRIQMLMNFPFFGILALNLEMRMDYTVKTAATDGQKFYYNPCFIKQLSEGERNWIVVHEVLHPALKHLWRRGDKQKEKWNYACDYAIHDIMMQFINNSERDIKEKLKMPKGCLYDKQFENMSAEQIYDLLPSNTGNGNGNESGNGNGDGLLDNHDIWDDAETQNQSQVKAQDWEGKLVSAAQSAEGKSQGNVPAFLQRLLGKITKPQKNWRSLLAEFVEPEIDDYSFNPPDRRFGDSDFFLPDFNDETDTVKKLLFWVDTSGSISEKELSICYSEIVGAINQFSGKLSGHLGFFDHVAYETESFENVTDVLAIKPQGGGGTNFYAPFEYVNEKCKDDDISGIIMLTDGYATWPPQKITNGIPVLWIITNEDQTPPWGLHTTLKL